MIKLKCHRLHNRKIIIPTINIKCMTIGDFFFRLEVLYILSIKNRIVCPDNLYTVNIIHKGKKYTVEQMYTMP